jgi:alkyl sulfatase BDS1-like metallo-beta-lactamase superfamily hydrolase
LPVFISLPTIISPTKRLMLLMATQVIGPGAFGEHFVINITFTVLKKSFALELKNSMLNHKNAPLRHRQIGSTQLLLAII